MTSYKIFILIFVLISSNCKKYESEIQEVKVKWSYTNIEKNDILELDKLQDFKEVPKITELASLLPNKKGYLLLKGSFDYTSSELSNLSISTGKLIHSEETYLNGKFLGSNLRPLNNWSEWNFWNQYRNYSIPESTLVSGENHLYLRIYVEAEGKVNDTILVGNRSDLDRRIFYLMFFESYFNGIVSFLFLIISLYHLLIYSKRKKDKENLYYSVFAFSYSIYGLNFISWLFANFLSISYLNFQKIIFITLYISAYSIYRFISVFLKRKDHKFVFYSYIAFAVIPCILTLVSPNYEFLFNIRSITSFFLMPFLLYTLFIPVYNFIKYRNPEAKAMLFSLIIIFISAIHDIANVVLKLQTPFWLGIAIPLFMASIMFLLGTKFAEVHNQTDELNEKLEEKVEERTKEVLEKMELIKALNIQQDGDYYLTSLIAKPLGTNYNKSKYFKTEFFLEQKKKFQFKNRNAELGGDICITGNLRFGDGKDRYVFFFNGDAMGKSMQGAGGAIVAGTVLNNILARSAKNNKILKMQPSEWISEVYNELHSVFTTFGGSMLMSCACGLINERTKKMWYFNAEHPYTVLFRDGKAEFIDSAIELRKLGTVLEGNTFLLKEFQLAEGDILFAGSDGRDDIHIFGTPEKEINEDETLFLKVIEKSNGDLPSIIENLKKTGNITDDLSVIKIAFQYIESESIEETHMIQQAEELMKQGNFSESESLLLSYMERKPNDPKALELLSNQYYEDKDFSKAIEYFTKLLDKQGEDLEIIFNLSLCYKQVKNYEKSIELSEIILQKNPKKISNIINLADSYRLIGNYSKSREILKIVIDSMIYYDNANKLDKLLNAKGF
jgi:tetratricopeptide (TPR) repeat protein